MEYTAFVSNVLAPSLSLRSQFLINTRGKPQPLTDRNDESRPINRKRTARRRINATLNMHTNGGNDTTEGVIKASVMGGIIGAILAFSSVNAVHAVSGGGKDFASQNHSNEIFHGDYTEKDFSGGIFRNCDFNSSILTSTRFFKAELRESDLSNTDLSYATIEAAILRDTVFENAVMKGTYISDSILESRSIKNVDFTDALISPISVVSKLCERVDAQGTNSVTGVSTRESLMCPDQ